MQHIIVDYYLFNLHFPLIPIGYFLRTIDEKFSIFGGTTSGTSLNMHCHVTSFLTVGEDKIVGTKLANIHFSNLICE